MIPMPTKDTPDAMVWRDGTQWHYLCAKCAGTDVRANCTTEGGAYRAAFAHLWRIHTMRRCWVVAEQPDLEPMTQVAFDLAIQHNRSF